MHEDGDGDRGRGEMRLQGERKGRRVEYKWPPAAGPLRCLLVMTTQLSAALMKMTSNSQLSLLIVFSSL